LGHPIGASGAIYALYLKFLTQFAAGSFQTKNFVADFIPLNLNFIHKNDKFAF